MSIGTSAPKCPRCQTMVMDINMLCGKCYPEGQAISQFVEYISRLEKKVKVYEEALDGIANGFPVNGAARAIAQQALKAAKEIG